MIHHRVYIENKLDTVILWAGYGLGYGRFFLRCFRDPIRVPRIENRIPRIRENYHRVPRN